MSHREIYKRILKRSFCILISIIFISAIGGTDYTNCMSFSKSNVSLNCGQSVYLKLNSKPVGKVRWYTNDNSIARVNDSGFVDTLSPGIANITAVNASTGEKTICTVNVLPKESVKFAYGLPNNAEINSDISLIAITHNDIEDVQFHVNNGTNKYLINSSRSVDGNTYVWTGIFKSSICGTYDVKAFAKKSGNWSTCNNGSFDVLVSSNSDYKAVSFDSKRISDKCVEFIASCEGFVSDVYRDFVNVPSIGYGYMIIPYVPFYNNMTKREAFGLLLNNLNKGPYSKSINEFMVKNNIMFSQAQFDALVSFSYNLGTWWTRGNTELSKVLMESGTATINNIGILNSGNGINVRSSQTTSSRILKIIKNNSKVIILENEKYNNNWYKIKTMDGVTGYCHGDFINLKSEQFIYKNLDLIDKKRFIDIFLSYHHAGKKCVKGLLLRRFHELDMFLYGQYNKYSFRYANRNNYPIPSCIKSI